MQIACSDMVVMNKVDLAGPERVAAVRRWIDHHFNNIRVFETNFAEVPNESLAVGGGASPRQRSRQRHICQRLTTRSSTPGAMSRANRCPCRCSPTRCGVCPERAFRCKGIVHTADAPDLPSILQVVCRRVEITTGESWRGEPRTRVVVIGPSGRWGPRRIAHYF